MRVLRKWIVAVAASAVLALAGGFALAAPSALGPTGTAATEQYCPPAVKQRRQRAVAAANARVQAAARALANLRAAQAEARAAFLRKLAGRKLTEERRAQLLARFVLAQRSAYRAQAGRLAALRGQLRAAQAQLRNCD